MAGNSSTAFSSTPPRGTARSEAAGLPSITLSPRERFDLEMIAIGAFSPLTGFMGKADFDSRLQKHAAGRRHRLADSRHPLPRPTKWPPKSRSASKLALKDEQGPAAGH